MGTIRNLALDLLGESEAPRARRLIVRGRSVRESRGTVRSLAGDILGEGFDYRAAELYSDFIEGHQRKHRDSDGRLDTEEKESCPFCSGKMKVGQKPNESIREDFTGGHPSEVANKFSSLAVGIEGGLHKICAELAKVLQDISPDEAAHDAVQAYLKACGQAGQILGQQREKALGTFKGYLVKDTYANDPTDAAHDAYSDEPSDTEEVPLDPEPEETGEEQGLEGPTDAAFSTGESDPESDAAGEGDDPADPEDEDDEKDY